MLNSSVLCVVSVGTHLSNRGTKTTTYYHPGTLFGQLQARVGDELVLSFSFQATAACRCGAATERMSLAVTELEFGDLGRIGCQQCGWTRKDGYQWWLVNSGL